MNPAFADPLDSDGEDYEPGALGPSDFEQDEDFFGDDHGLGLWPPSPSDDPDGEGAEQRAHRVGGTPAASGEENLPASCPTAEATAVRDSPEKLQLAPAPPPNRPAVPPLKPAAAGTINKKKPKRVIAAARPGKLRPFRCTYDGCGYAAAKRRYLLEHERVHSGERPYKCTWPGCSYAASGQGHISRHKRTHTGDRPYPCEFPGCTYQVRLVLSLSLSLSLSLFLPPYLAT